MTMDLRRFVGVCISLSALFMDYSEIDDLNLGSVRSLENSAVEAAYLAGCATGPAFAEYISGFSVLRHFMLIFSLCLIMFSFCCYSLSTWRIHLAFVMILSLCQIPTHLDPFVLPSLNLSVTPSSLEILPFTR